MVVRQKHKIWLIPVCLLCWVLRLHASQITIINDFGPDTNKATNQISSDERVTVSMCSQHHRQKLIREFCTSNRNDEFIDVYYHQKIVRESVRSRFHRGAVDYEQYKFLLDTILVDDDQQRIFCSTHGTDSQLWKQLQKKNCDESNCNLKPLSAYQKSKIIDILNTYTQILVVDHPFVRLLENWKSERGNLENINFENYVNFLSEKDPNKIPEIKTISGNCKPCIMNYTYVAKLETIDEDIENIQNKNFQSDAKYKDNLISEEPGYRGFVEIATEKYKYEYREMNTKKAEIGKLYNFEGISGKLLDLIIKVYWDDFFMLGYDFILETNAALCRDWLKTDRERCC